MHPCCLVLVLLQRYAAFTPDARSSTCLRDRRSNALLPGISIIIVDHWSLVSPGVVHHGITRCSRWNHRILHIMGSSKRCRGARSLRNGPQQYYGSEFREEGRACGIASLSSTGAAGISSSPGVAFTRDRRQDVSRNRCKYMRLEMLEKQLLESLQHCCSMGLPTLPHPLQPQHAISEVSVGIDPQLYRIFWDRPGGDVFWNSCVIIDR